MERGWTRHLLLGVCAVVVALGVVGSVSTGDLPGNGDHWTVALAALAYALLGWVILGRADGRAVGWVLLVAGLASATAFAAGWWSVQALYAEPGALPGGRLAAWLQPWVQILVWPLFIVAPLVLLPAGRPRSRRWRWFVVAAGSVFGLFAAVAAVLGVPAVLGDHPEQVLDLPGVQPTGWAVGVVTASSLAFLVSFLAVVVSLVGVAWAWFRARGPERRVFSVVLTAVGVVVVGFVVAALVGPVTGQRHQAPEWIGEVLLLLVPAAITLAIVRFRAYEIRAAVSRSVLVLLVGSALAAVYLGVLALFAVLLGDSVPLTPATVVAAGAVAMASIPVVGSGRTLTRRWFGRQTGPTQVASLLQVGRGTTRDAADSLQVLAATVRDELRLGSVALAVEGLPTAVTGEPGGEQVRVPLRYGATDLGSLLVTARPGEALAEPDLCLLRDVAWYVAAAAESIRVSAGLRQAQHALETAHAEERRRIRRDLHDGVAPTLASARLQLASLRRSLDDARLDHVVGLVADAISEVRRVVDGLHPSVLEDLGLVPALQILVADVRRSTDIALDFEPPPTLPELSAETANTAYRVASEALANVVRHSSASACELRIGHQEGMLSVEVVDDGRGFDVGTAKGMGLRNIVDRAALARGVATIESGPGRGASVLVRLPA